jgi:hypothetical protein
VLFNYQLLPEMGRGNVRGGADSVGEGERIQRHFGSLTPPCAEERTIARGCDNGEESGGDGGTEEGDKGGIGLCKVELG